AAAAFGLPVFDSGSTTSLGVKRQITYLDGEWEVGETFDSRDPPSTFMHRAPVPGLTHSAIPPFTEVDQFQSREYIEHLIGLGHLSASARIADIGTSHQPRNYFWYRT